MRVISISIIAALSSCAAAEILTRDSYPFNTANHTSSAVGFDSVRSKDYEGSTTLSEETYVFTRSKTVAASETYVFSNLKSLDSEKSLENKGRLEVNAKDYASIGLERFVNHIGAQTQFFGTGDLKVTVKDSLTNWIRSSIKVAVDSRLEFTFQNAEQRFLNSGRFSASAQDIKFTCPNDVVNDDELLIKAQGRGEYQFGKITNLEMMELQAETLEAPMTFDRLLNGGDFYFSCGGDIGIAVDAKGPVDNLGSILFESNSGTNSVRQGGDIHNSGLICLHSMNFEQSAGIDGDGCWGLSSGSSLEIDATQAFAESQSILLFDDSAHIVIKKFGERAEVYNVYGFLLSGEAIVSDVELFDALYSPITGHLLVYLINFECLQFDIGKGYEPYGFAVEGRNVVYLGNVLPERPVPQKCKCSVDPSGRGKREVTEPNPAVLTEMSSELGNMEGSASAQQNPTQS